MSTFRDPEVSNKLKLLGWDRRLTFGTWNGNPGFKESSLWNVSSAGCTVGLQHLWNRPGPVLWSTWVPRMAQALYVAVYDFSTGDDNHNNNMLHMTMNIDTNSNIDICNDIYNNNDSKSSSNNNSSSSRNRNRNKTPAPTIPTPTAATTITRTKLKSNNINKNNMFQPKIEISWNSIMCVYILLYI